MELHRCRFIPYNPQAINALEFSHPPSSKATGQGAHTLRLAVGRANGDIEIWNPLRGAWFQESIIRGGKGRSIEGLAWTLDPATSIEEVGPSEVATGTGLKLPGRLRLFSIGYTNTVTEWDLEKGKPARHSSGSYGEIWCLTAQPRWTPPPPPSSSSAEKTNTGGGGSDHPAEGEYTGQHLAIGCADGSIVILSTADSDLRFVRRLNASVTKNVRVLSITFQTRHVLAAGYADSSIRLFDIRNGRLLRTVSLGRGPLGGPKDILVWSVKSLPDGTLVSGDSTGEIRFWDAKNYSLVQRLRGHQADVLDVAVSVDGETVISGGADRRTVLCRLKSGGAGSSGGSKKKNNDKSARRWVEIMHRRYHTHDVKKFAVYESKDMSIAVSGGPDASLVVMPLRESGKEHHRTLSSLPQICQLASGSASRYMMSFWEREVRIWKIASENRVDSGQRHKLMARVLIPGDENITSATLSTDGSLLVLSTMTTIRMFNLFETDAQDDDQQPLKIKDLKLPPQITADGARVVSLSPDRRWLSIVRPDNQVQLAKLSTETSNSTVSTHHKTVQVQSKLLHLQRSTGRTQTFRGVNQGTLGDYDRTIRSVTFSSDSKLFATGDLAGFVDCWSLVDVEPSKFTNGLKSDDQSDEKSSDEDDDDDDENSVLDGQSWRLLPAIPCFHSGIIFMSFRPSISASPSGSSGSARKEGEDRLLVLTSKHQLTEYEVRTGKFSEWSQRNPKSCLPEEFLGLKDRAIGGVCELFHGAPKLLLYGPSWIWMFDLTSDFPLQSAASPAAAAVPHSNAIPSKRKRSDDDGNEGNDGLEDEDVVINEKEKNTDPDGDEPERFRRLYNSGAGDLIPKSQATVSMGTKMRKIQHGQQQEQWIEIESHRLDRHRNHADADGDDADEEFDSFDGTNNRAEAGGADFARLRRRMTDGVVRNGESESSLHTNGGVANGVTNDVVKNTTAPSSSENNTPSFAVVINQRTTQKNPHQDSNHEHEHEHQHQHEHATDSKSLLPPNASQPSASATASVSAPGSGSTVFWHSYKFRDILGVLPLGSSLSPTSTTQSQSQSQSQPQQSQNNNLNLNDHAHSHSQNHSYGYGYGAGHVELAIVERPMWDMDLGERYVKDYE